MHFHSRAPAADCKGHSAVGGCPFSATEATGGNQGTCHRELNSKFRITSGSGYTETKRMTLLK